MNGGASTQHQRRQSKKAARRKAVVAQKRKQAFASPSKLDQARLAAASYGVSHCLMTKAMFEQGMGHVILGRTKPSTTVAAAFFLVDVNCLGVKNAFYTEIGHRELTDKIDVLMMSDVPLLDIAPHCARKIVTGAVAYARELGFSPHRDYASAEALFGDVDATECSTDYQYGRDGKPFYFAGPYETPSTVRRTLRRLTERVGEGNFDYMTQADPF